MRVGKAVIELDRLLVMPDRFLDTALRAQGLGHVVVHGRVVGSQCEGASDALDRVGRLPALTGNDAAQVKGVGIFGLGLEYGVIDRLGLVELAGLVELGRVLDGSGHLGATIRPACEKCKRARLLLALGGRFLRRPFPGRDALVLARRTHDCADRLIGRRDGVRFVWIADAKRAADFVGLETQRHGPAHAGSTTTS